MKTYHFFSFYTSLFLFLVGITACQADKKYPDTERTVPLNEKDRRYAEEPALFTLKAQEGILRLNRDSACYMTYPNPRTSSFRETLLPIRLPSLATICRVIDWYFLYLFFNLKKYMRVDFQFHAYAIGIS